MIRRVSLAVALVLALGLLVAAPAFAAPAQAPGQPSFAPSVFADGQVFGTKFTTELPPPNGRDDQSYDGLYAFTNSNASGQLSVSEAGPGNPSYNGGRWQVYSATWTPEGFAAHGGTVPVLRSYAEILDQISLGYLSITLGPPAGGPPPYFQCPLLPLN